MKGKGGNWTFDDLNKFLTNPKGFIPGHRDGLRRCSEGQRARRHHRLSEFELGAPGSDPNCFEVTICFARPQRTKRPGNAWPFSHGNPLSRVCYRDVSPQRYCSRAIIMEEKAT